MLGDIIVIALASCNYYTIRTCLYILLLLVECEYYKYMHIVHAACMAWVYECVPFWRTIDTRSSLVDSRSV